MAQTDRTLGLVGNAGMKVPVRVATTAAIVLSGEQTVDGVAVVTGERVLVKDQASAVDNGIYVVDTGSWSRSKDCNGAYDLVKGSWVYVNEGTTHAGAVFQCTTSDTITIGTSELNWSRVAISFNALSSHTATDGQTVFNLSITYQPAQNQLEVFVNGIRQRVTQDYTETSASVVTFTYPLTLGDEVDFLAGQSVGSLNAAAAQLVSVLDTSDFYIGATVEAILAELGVSVEPDNGDAPASLIYGASAQIQRWNTPLAASRAVTLSTTNAKEGARFLVIRGAGATGDFDLTVGSSLCTLSAPGEWCSVRYDTGVGWILEAYGRLPSSELRGVGSNVGDADATLTVGSSHRTQRWETALTADRTATLSDTRAHKGARFRIYRGQTAGGNFSLIVANASAVHLARLAPGEYCDVEHTGTAWVVTAIGNIRPGNSSMIELYDDFVGEEIDAYRWQWLIGSDAEVVPPLVRANQIGGRYRMTTGDDAAASMAVNGVQLLGRLNWRASQGGLVWEGNITLDVITAVCLFIGFTDQVGTLEAPFELGAGDVLTSNATDAVGVLFDTGADTDNWWLVGVANDVDATKQNAGVAPVAGTLETWRIEISATGVARFYRNGTLVGSAMTGAVTPGTALAPVVAAFSRGAASRNVDGDFIKVRAQR